MIYRFLCYLDGVEDIDGIFIVAITTRPDLIDPAIIRAGRIDQHIKCDLPEDNDRMKFFKNRLSLLSCSADCMDDSCIDELVRKTEGFSYANLAGYLRNLQIVFFDKLSKHDALEDKTDIEDPFLNRDDLMDTLDKSEALGKSKEYAKLAKIYDEFSKKGLIVEKPGSKGQISK